MAAIDFFLKLDGIPGESSDSKHTNEIELHAVHMAVLQTSTTSSATGGQGGGKAAFEGIHCKAVSSKASPKLFLQCCNGQPIANAVLSIRKAGGTQQDFYVFTMTNVLISSFKTGAGFQLETTNDNKTISWSGSDGDESQTESLALQHCIDHFSLSYGSLDIAYSPQVKDGSVGDAIHGGWNVQTNA